MNDIRPLIEDCCGWNRRTWADAVSFALSALPSDLSGKRVLEIGAGKYSCLAPVFAALGAEVTCSYYGQARHAIETGRLREVSRKYGITGITLREVDIHDFVGTYDIIVLKSVLGGICRGGDVAKMRSIVRGLVGHLSEDGVVLTFDNGHVGPFAKLNSLLGAGRNRWTYFRRAELDDVLAGYEHETRGFGFLNVGAARFALRRDVEALEAVNDAIHAVDSALLRLFGFRERAVYGTVIRNRAARAPAAAAVSSGKPLLSGGV
ncbi:hypothetical protein [Azospirillum sp.]|uniref:hypothetical protein n=1 Tax=Azospirillum sp. TaxID=34012 RepID=UPI003D70373C